MEQNAEKQKKLLEEEEELKKLRELAEQTKRAQQTIEKTLAEKQQDLLEQKKEIAKKIGEIESDNSKILAEEPATEASTVLETTPVVEPEVESEIKPEKDSRALRQDIENANPDGNGTQVLLGDVSDTEVVVEKPVAPAEKLPVNAQTSEPAPIPVANVIPNVEPTQNLSQMLEQNSQIQPEGVTPQLPAELTNDNQVVEDVPEAKINPEIEIISSNANLAEQQSNPDSNQNSDFTSNVLQQFPQETPSTSDSVGPVGIDVPEQNPKVIGDDGELLQPDFTFENSLSDSNKTKDEIFSSENNTEGEKSKNNTDAVVEKPKATIEQNVVPMAQGSSMPSAMHPTPQPLASNYRSINDLVSSQNAENDPKKADVKSVEGSTAVTNVENINNVQNSSPVSNIDQSTNTQNIEQPTPQVIATEEKKPEEENKEVVNNQIEQSGNVLPPLPAGNVSTSTTIEKVNKVEKNIEKVIPGDSPKDSEKKSSPATANIILILLLVISLVLIITIIYFSYVQTPEAGSIWFEIRQNIDNFRSALGI